MQKNRRNKNVLSASACMNGMAKPLKECLVIMIRYKSICIVLLDMRMIRYLHFIANFIAKVENLGFI